MKQETENKLDEMLRDALQEAAYAEREPSFADRDAFQNWLEEGRCRRNLARRRKIRCAGLAAAAVFLCVFLLSGSLFFLSDSLPPSLQNLLTPDEGIATPDCGQDLTCENGSIVIGGDGNGNAGTWTATFASYEELPEKYREQIIWFENMPEGYELENIKIQRNDNYFSMVTTYNCSGCEKLRIKQMRNYTNAAGAAILNQNADIVQVDNYEVYIKESDDALMYSMVLNENAISILDYGKLPNKKIEAMIASAKTDWNTK